MADIAPMLGAILGISKTPKGQDKKRGAKPTSKKGKVAAIYKTTKGEMSVTSPGQQHGELASYKEPTEHQRMKENAKGTMRRATDDWVEGRISTKEHKMMHERAKHVLSGKQPREFKGMSGERSYRKMR